MKSWAVPKGISLDPKIKRLAVLTEDHSLDYLLFEGVIPEGSYGAWTVIVWDTGTYTTEQEISEQFKKGKITFTLFGQKLKGRFTLIRIRSRDGEGEDENQWLLIKSADEFEFKENLTITRPESVLNKITSEDLENIEKGEGRDNTIFASQQQQQVEEEREFPTKVKPMLSTLVDEPFNSKDWVFEIKWDGVSSILFLCKTKEILEFQSRNGKLITHRYPELVRDLKSPPILSSSSHSAKSVKNQQF